MIFERGAPGYEEARLAAVWNQRKPDRFPAAILIAEQDDDVVEAVRLARARGWQIGIRSGGHSWVGNGVRDGGLLLDLSRLDSISVDAPARVAVVGPAAKGPAINEALLRHGLFFPTGHAPTVGIGGFILGGGYGWNSRAMGPACLSIRAIDVVLPDGEFVYADDTSHPDLMWAARGSGPGFFGIVTRFHLDVFPAPTRIRRTTHTYPAALARDLMTWSYEHLETLSPSVEFSAKVGQVASLTATAFGPEDDLASLEAIPFRDQAIAATVDQETSIAELYEIADRLNPPGLRWAVDGIWASGDPGVLLEAAAPMLATVPDSMAFVLWMLWGGFPEQENACWSAQAKVYLSPNAGWCDPADDLAREQWVHGTLASIQHLSEGLQFSDNNLADRPDHGLSPANAARLEEIRSKYDPLGRLATYMQPDQSTTAYGLSSRAS